VAISPVLVGATLGFERTGRVDTVVALLVFGAALLMHVITNLQNDVGYTVRGGETRGSRSGLLRATANGWLSVRQVRLGIVVVSVVAVGFGLGLVAYRGWPVLLIGSLSLLAALAYMCGPLPIAYTPLGELTVFLFFGLVAVLGTDWVLTGSIGAVSVLAAVAIGGRAAAALAVNNHRDISHDRSMGRQTFDVRYGERASHQLVSMLLLFPFLLVPMMAVIANAIALLVPLLLLPAAWALRQDFMASAPGRVYNLILFRTFRLNLWFAALLSAAALLGRFLG